MVIVARFIADDDSSIKAKLKWNNANHMTNNDTTDEPAIINLAGDCIKRPDCGAIPSHVPEPTFIADPNHRRKTLAGNLCALADKAKLSPDEQLRRKLKQEAKSKGNPKAEIDPKPLQDEDSWKTFTWNLTMTKMDVGRLSKNFAFVARTLRHRSNNDERLQAGKAVSEHHFDSHQPVLWCMVTAQHGGCQQTSQVKGQGPTVV